jgi:hypothetical protein
MLLVKSCDSRFNPKNCGTIKIGSLYEYRNTEIEEIADKSEGFFDFRIRIGSPVPVPIKWFNYIMSGSVSLGGAEYDSMPNFPGRMSVDIESLRATSRSDEHVVLTDTVIDIHREDINGFIFCMSLLRRTRDSEGIFKGYNDKWYCSSLKAGRIAHCLAHSVLRKAIEDLRSGELLIPELKSEKDINVFVRHGLVKYTSREMYLTPERGYELDEFFSTLQDMSFIKPVDPFSIEREYRFHMLIVVGGRIVEPWKNSIIVDASNMIGIIL